MKILAILGFAAFAIACDSPTSPTSTASLARAGGTANAVIFNEHVEVIGTGFTACTGDEFEIPLKIHDLFAITFDGAGGGHVKIHSNIQGQATSPITGITYVVSQVDNFEDNFKFGEELTETFHIFFVSKGNAPNYEGFEDFHITITPNGDVTSFHDNIRERCQ